MPNTPVIFCWKENEPSIFSLFGFLFGYFNRHATIWNMFFIYEINTAYNKWLYKTINLYT